MSTNLRMRSLLRREDLVLPELSYQIIGILFDVYNKLRYGFQEKTYQKAIAAASKNAGLQYKEQLYVPLTYADQRIGSYYLDFLIEDNVILEIKRGDRFIKAHIDQVYQYLVAKKLQLGILAYFAPRNLHFKRIANLTSVHS